MRKGQLEFSAITFIMIVAGILIIAPIMIKMYRVTLEPLQNALEPMSPSAGEAVGHIKDVGTNFWDFVIVMAFLVQMVMLFLSAFLINTHPIFLAIYVVFFIFAVIFIPAVIELQNQVWLNVERNDTLRAQDMEHLSLSDTIRSNYAILMIAILAITGVISLGKMRGGSGGAPTY